jgi:iron complex transport system substrate-binding protein
MRMRRIVIAVLVLLLPHLPVRAASLDDATGRTVQLPDHVARVLPAGPPAAVLLAALAPDLMLGWPMQLGAAAQAALPPDVAALPPVPHVAATPDGEAAVRALHPDVIVDYGTVSTAYISRAEKTQADTGIPTVLLDGRLEETPRVLRSLGAALGRTARGAELAAMAEAVLALPVRGGPRRVLYARGPDGTLVAAPGTGNTEIFARLGWTVLAPPGSGTFRRATMEEIAALDPDIVIFADPAARQAAVTPVWQAVRAVREGHAYIAPAAPFGWIEEPPSLNRLLGLAWLGGGDAATLAALFGR